MELYENSQSPEIAMLVGIDTDDYDAEVSIDELEELVSEIDPTAEFNKTMAAEEYRQSISGEIYSTYSFDESSTEDVEELVEV